mgnify:CR=1 FL=1
MIYFIDFDYTIADTSINSVCSGNWKEKQKLIPQYKIYKEAVDFLFDIKNNPVYIVSGNVGSTIKKAIKYFNLPISEDRVVGYRQGMPMQNLQRKIAVIKAAIKKFKLEDKLNEIVYIGDEIDDKTACKIVGINFKYSEFNK